jgi:hypothetical protein
MTATLDARFRGRFTGFSPYDDCWRSVRRVRRRGDDS